MPRDGALPSHPLTQPRAYGRAQVESALKRGESRLENLHQSGSAKVLLPQTAGADLTAILLNTAGGITGGDRFAYGASAGADSFLTLSTQAAERAYRAQPGEVGEMAVTLRVGANARIDWLPQETILFDGSHLRRRLNVDFASSARLLAVEAVILGRPAMGERLSDFCFTDQWRVTRDGKLIYADALRLAPDAMSGPATLQGAGAFASVLLATADAEAHLTALRTLVGPDGGASIIRPGILAARILAADGFALRRILIPALEALRAAPLPKVWRL
jgi:urease accessory protein